MPAARRGATSGTSAPPHSRRAVRSRRRSSAPAGRLRELNLAHRPQVGVVQHDARRPQFVEQLRRPRAVDADDGGALGRRQQLEVLAQRRRRRLRRLRRRRLRRRLRRALGGFAGGGGTAAPAAAAPTASAAATAAAAAAAAAGGRARRRWDRRRRRRRRRGLDGDKLRRRRQRRGRQPRGNLLGGGSDERGLVLSHGEDARGARHLRAAAAAHPADKLLFEHPPRADGEQLAHRPQRQLVLDQDERRAVAAARAARRRRRRLRRRRRRGRRRRRLVASIERNRLGRRAVGRRRRGGGGGVALRVNLAQQGEEGGPLRALLEDAARAQRRLARRCSRRRRRRARRRRRCRRLHRRAAAFAPRHRPRRPRRRRRRPRRRRRRRRRERLGERPLLAHELVHAISREDVDGLRVLEHPVRALGGRLRRRRVEDRLEVLEEGDGVVADEGVEELAQVVEVGAQRLRPPRDAVPHRLELQPHDGVERLEQRVLDRELRDVDVRRAAAQLLQARVDGLEQAPSAAPGRAPTARRGAARRAAPPPRARRSRSGGSAATAAAGARTASASAAPPWRSPSSPPARPRSAP